MTVIRQYQLGRGPNNKGGGGPFGWVGSIIMLTVGLVLTYLVIKGIFNLLLWFSIPLFIAGIALDPKGALSFGKSLVNLSQKNPLVPLGVVGLSVLFFPTVPFILAALTGGLLLAKFFIKRKFKSVFDQHIPKEEESEDFVDFEEVTEDEDFLELPDTQPEPQAQKNSGNEYDNMF